MPTGNEKTRFKPGNKLGKGRPRTPDEIKGLATLTKSEALKALSDALKLKPEELELLLVNPEATMMELCAAKVVQLAYKQGDPMRLDFLLNRIVGKVPQPTEIEIKQPKPVVIEYLDGEKTYLGPPLEEKKE